jgi:hypothetical protein
MHFFTLYKFPICLAIDFQRFFPNFETSFSLPSSTDQSLKPVFGFRWQQKIAANESFQIRSLELNENIGFQ